MDHAEIQELLPLKALGRLDGAEARAVEEHLAAGCDGCARKLASFNGTLAAMAFVEAGDGPADHVWNRLQSRLDAARDQLPRPIAEGSRRSDPRLTRQSSPRRGGFAIFGSAAAAAIVAVVASSVYFTSQLRGVTSDAANKIAALTARVDAVQSNLDTTGDQLAALQAKVAQTTDLTLASLGPDARVVHLAGLPAAPSAAGTVVLSRTEGVAILKVIGLPPMPADKVYEAWWIGEKLGPLKAGLFAPSTRGSALVSLSPPPGGEVVLASAIALEPRGGAEKPSGAMYLKGDFPRR